MALGLERAIPGMARRQDSGIVTMALASNPGDSQLGAPVQRGSLSTVGCDAPCHTRQALTQDSTEPPGVPTALSSYDTKDLLISLGGSRPRV